MRFQHAGRSTEGLVDTQLILMKAGVRSGDTVLDAGCGYGYFALAAARFVGPVGKVYGVDSFEPAITEFTASIARLRLPNVTPLLADITKNIPLEDASVDMCHMGSVLHGFTENGEQGPALKELSRVMKSGSRLAVVEFKMLENTPGPPLSVRITAEQVVDLTSPCGFVETSRFEAGKFHYGIILTKQA